MTTLTAAPRRAAQAHEPPFSPDRARRPALGLLMVMLDGTIVSCSSYALARAHAEEARARERVDAIKIVCPPAQDAPTGPSPAGQTAILKARAELARREDLAIRRALTVLPDYLEKALGARPQAPAARRSWEQAAARVERYRFRHDVRDEQRTLGKEPDELRQRAEWREARRDLDRQRAELARDPSRAAARDIGRELG